MSKITHLHQLKKTAYLSFSPLEQYDFLLHGFVLRTIVNKNLEEFVEKLGLRKPSIIGLEQVHSKRILAVRKRSALKGIETKRCDGILTDVSRIVLTVKVADCVPIFLVDPERRISGLIHAGWKGTLLGIAKEGVRQASQIFGCSPENLIVVLGPCIGACCYQVSDSLAILFPRDCLDFTQNGINLDLVKANLKQLLQSGVRREKIFSSNLCTFCKPELFYSYRRDKDNRKKMTAFTAIK
jgi:YfiH family protein